MYTVLLRTQVLLLTLLSDDVSFDRESDPLLMVAVTGSRLVNTSNARVGRFPLFVVELRRSYTCLLVSSELLVRRCFF